MRISAAAIVLAWLAAISVAEKAPGLRPDDGDPDVGGAGRGSTCAVPSSEAGSPSDPNGKAGGAPHARPLRVRDENGALYIDENMDHVFKNATERGDPECQYWVGRIYESGFEGDGREIIEPDVNQAAMFYSAAAESGHAAAACALGCLFAEHNDAEKAAEHFMRSVELGSFEGVARLGQLYAEAGHNEEAVALFSQAAEHGEPLGQAKLGELLAAGVLVDQDFNAAARLLKAAVDKGEVSAHYGLGQLYEGGHLGGVDLELAAQEYRKGAEGGDERAAKNWARCLRHGIGVEKCPSEADAWEPEQTELDTRRETKKRMEQEIVGAKRAGVLLGGRPSRYEYVPIKFRPETDEEKQREESEGWDGAYQTMDGELARFKYAGNEKYFALPNVVWPSTVPAAAAA